MGRIIIMLPESEVVGAGWASWSLLAVVLMVVFLAGCRQEAVQQADQAGRPALSRTFAAGKLRLDLSVDRTEMTVADRLALSLSVSAPEDLVAKFPDLGNRLGDFIVVESREIPARMTGDGKVENAVNLILEPFLAGTYHIPPIRVAFRKQGADEKDGQTLATDEIVILVRSILAQNEATTISDIAPPVAQPRDRITLVLTGIGGVVVLAALGSLVYWRRGRRKGERAGTVSIDPPHTRAYQELEQLLVEDLLARGETKVFHVRLSNIMRRYIEKRFAVMAPERTTEEFLVEIENSGFLRTGHRIMLRDFLSRCDLVKFARHEPDELESGQTIDLCRQFIRETEPALVAEKGA